MGIMVENLLGSRPPSIYQRTAGGGGARRWSVISLTSMKKWTRTPAERFTRLVIGWCGGFMGLCVAGGCSSPVTASKEGKVLFETTCVTCHGADGVGVDVWKLRLGVPDLTDPALHARLSDADIRTTIKEGSKSKKMPPWGGVYSDEQVDALVSYVRGFKR
jgi:mono/diheme cytochrome c family protein